MHQCERTTSNPCRFDIDVDYLSFYMLHVAFDSEVVWKSTCWRHSKSNGLRFDVIVFGSVHKLRHALFSDFGSPPPRHAESRSGHVRLDTPHSLSVTSRIFCDGWKVHLRLIRGKLTACVLLHSLLLALHMSVT